MTPSTATLDSADGRARYLLPIKLSILLSMAGEFVIFVVWGLVLYPEGSVLNKLLWTVLFCGLGMGAAVGALISIFVVDRLARAAAVLATAALSTLVLGVGCNLLCLQLDNHFLYFGGAENGPLFVWNGVIMSLIGGLIVGWWCFGRKERVP